MVLLAALLGLLAIRMARRISDELRTREGCCAVRWTPRSWSAAASPRTCTTALCSNWQACRTRWQEWPRERTLPVMRTRAAPLGRRRSFTNIRA